MNLNPLGVSRGLWCRSCYSRHNSLHPASYRAVFCSRHAIPAEIARALLADLAVTSQIWGENCVGALARRRAFLGERGGMTCGDNSGETSSPGAVWQLSPELSVQRGDMASAPQTDERIHVEDRLGRKKKGSRCCCVASKGRALRRRSLLLGKA